MTTRRDISELAKKYWQEAGTPSAEQEPPQKFWLQAERELTPEIILAIANKLKDHGITRLAGDIFYEDFYYDEDFSPPSIFARGKLEENGIYLLRIPDVGDVRFDLNNEQELDRLIKYLVARKKHREDFCEFMIIDPPARPGNKEN